LIARCIGWLLDVSIEQDKAVLWIKTVDKNILRLTDTYQPFFIYYQEMNKTDNIFFVFYPSNLR
jgi:hypothetical protein